MSSNPYIGDTTPFYFSTYAAMDAKYDSMKFAANLGYKFRSTGEAIEDENYFNPPIEPASHEFFFSGGLNFPISKQGEITTELCGSMLLGDFADSSDRESYSAGKYLASYKHELRSGIALNGGLGTELMHGVGSADLRLFAGISYEFNGARYLQVLANLRELRGLPKADDDIYGIHRRVMNQLMTLTTTPHHLSQQIRSGKTRLMSQFTILKRPNCRRSMIRRTIL